MKKSQEKTNKEGILDAIKYPVHLLTCLSPCTTLHFTNEDADFVPKTRNKVCHKCGCQKKEKALKKNFKQSSSLDNISHNKQPYSQKDEQTNMNIKKKKENDLFQEPSLVIQQTIPDQINLNTCIYCSNNIPDYSGQKQKQEIKENLTNDNNYQSNSSISIKVTRQKSENETPKRLHVPKKITKIPEHVKRKRGYNGYVFTSEIDKTPSSATITINHTSQDDISEPIKPKNVPPYIIDSMVCRCNQKGIKCPTYPKYHENNLASNDSICEPRKNLYEKTPQIVNNCVCNKNYDSIKCSCPKKQETDKLVSCDCKHKTQKIISCACVPPKEPVVSCTCDKKHEKIIQRSESHAQTDLKYIDLRLILPTSTDSTQTDENKTYIKSLEDKGSSPIKIEENRKSPIKIEENRKSPIKIEENRKSPIIVHSIDYDKYDSKPKYDKTARGLLKLENRKERSATPATPRSEPTTPKKKKKEKNKEALSGSKSKLKFEPTPAYTMPCIELNSTNNLEQILKLSSIIQSKNEEINRLNSLVRSNQSSYRKLNDQPQTIKIVFENLPCSITQIKEITQASPSQISKEDAREKETQL